MYLGLDVETGGIEGDVSLLTAYFGVWNKDFTLVDELDLKLIPDDGIYKVRGDALAVNKIDLTELAKVAMTYKQGGTALYKFLDYNALQAGDMLIPLGHNVFYDVECIQKNLISKGSWLSKVSYRTLDTMPIARFLKDAGKLDIEGISLGKLIEYFGIEIDGVAHEAKYDALATVEVYKRMLALING
jgi:DNA polymerase III alpha subunit (gram-positive type)